MVLLLLTHFVQSQIRWLQYPLFSTSGLESHLQRQILLLVFEDPYLQKY